MARIFITGSSQGLGLLAGRQLAAAGHAVVLHARNGQRAAAARDALPEAKAVLVADLSTVAAMRDLAEQANRLGRFDAVIHNAAVGYREKGRVETADGLSQLWAVNVLASYVLTALIRRPDRLVYVSSELHRRAAPRLDDPQWLGRPWNGTRAYSETKLHDAILAQAVARLWPDVEANALEPGWVPTRMGGPRATGDLEAGAQTQSWLAAGERSLGSGGYFYHRAPARLHASARDRATQDRLLAICTEASGVALTEG